MRARAALASLALAAGLLAGCGGDDDTTSAETAAGGAAGQSAGKQAKKGSGQGAAAQAGSGGKAAAKKGSGGNGESGGGSSANGGGSDSAAPTTRQPLPNEGSKTITPGVPTAKGGDNSIQEFGVEGESDQRVEAATTAKAYLDARAAGRWSAACAYLAGPVRKQIEAFAGAGSGSGACPEAMRTLTEGVSKGILRVAAEIEVLSMRAEGSRAFLIYRDGNGVPSQIPMSREGDKWKVAAIAGSPLVL